MKGIPQWVRNLWPLWIALGYIFVVVGPQYFLQTVGALLLAAPFIVGFALLLLALAIFLDWKSGGGIFRPKRNRK